MTRSQRRKQNRINAQKSTGPTSSSGKDIAKMNSLKHGLTAVEAVLPTEDPEILRDAKKEWAEALQPQGADQLDLVNTAALASVRLKRLAKAEESILDEQVRNAKSQFDSKLDRKLVDMQELLDRDPARAVIELKSFSKGVNWLIGEWTAIERIFELHKSLYHYETVRKALRFQGINPDRLYQESFHAIDFVMRSLCCRSPLDSSQDYREEAVRKLRISHNFEGLHNAMFRYDPAESIATMRQWIGDEISSLKQLLPALIASENASRECSEGIALAMDDTPKNRLMIRYAIAIQSGLDRALNTFSKMKKERENEQFAKAEEVPERALRNEAAIIAEASASPVHPGCYIIVNDKKYEVWDTSDGHLSLAFKEDLTELRRMMKADTDPKGESVPKTAG